MFDKKYLILTTKLLMQISKHVKTRTMKYRNFMGHLLSTAPTPCLEQLTKPSRLAPRNGHFEETTTPGTLTVTLSQQAFMWYLM